MSSASCCIPTSYISLQQPNLARRPPYLCASVLNDVFAHVAEFWMVDFLCKTPRAVGLALFKCTVVTIILNGDPVKYMLRHEHVKETMPGGGRGIGGRGGCKRCVEIMRTFMRS